MNPWLPVVVVTGYGSQENEMRADEVGVSGFLHKPVTPEVIEWMTRKTLSEKEEKAAAIAAMPAAATAQPAVEAAEERESVAKNIALFFAAPFVGLAYIIAFPFVGVYALMKWGFRSRAKDSAS